MKHEAPLDECFEAVALTEADVAPYIDAALAKLSEKDREAVILRYFQGLSYAEMSELQGGEENAARMRVDRALEKMRKYLARCEVAATTPLLHEVLPKTVRPVPDGLTQALARFNPFSPNVSHAVLAMAKGGTQLMPILINSTVTVAALTLLFVGKSMLSPGQAHATPKDPGALLLIGTQTGEGAHKTSLASNLPWLSRPFTLTYRLTVTNLMTDAQKQRLIDGEEKQLAEQIKQNPSRANEGKENLARHKLLWSNTAPRFNTVTISFDGKTLLYRIQPERNSEDLNSWAATVLVEGGKSFAYGDYVTHPSPNQTQFLVFSPYNNRMSDLPFVGANLPGYALESGGKYLTMGGIAPSRPFMDAQAVRPGGHLISLDYGYETIKLDAYTKFENIELPSRINRTNFYRGTKQNGPMYSYDYVLEKTSENPMDEAEFRMEKYLPNGTPLQIEDASGRPRVLFVGQQPGTLSEQIERLLNKSDPASGVGIRG
jgi:hypothetical protein